MNKLKLVLLSIFVAFSIVFLFRYSFPVMVSGHPISRLSLYRELRHSFGNQVLENTINEIVLNDAIKKSGLKIDQKKVSDRLTEIEKQFNGSGGLTQYLLQKDMTKDELVKQITNQIAIEAILQDKIIPTEEEINNEYNANWISLYHKKPLSDVRDQIIVKLKVAKTNIEFKRWFDEQKKQAKVINYGF